MRSLKIFALLMAISAGALMMPQGACAQRASVSFQVFYDQLSPYGMWVSYPNYGYVWIPSGHPGFSPYATAGHWVFTDDGWTWVSDYPWGWAPFHYGRWDYDNAYGWFWVPDNEWGPAWVSWRRSPGYYGWAPLGPGISVSVAFGGNYHERNERWIFVKEGDIARPDIGRHYVNRTNNTTIINNSTVIMNTRKDDKRNVTYVAGPERDEVQRVTHTTVKSVAIRDADQPGHHLSSGELQIYRPQVQKTDGNGQNPAPAKVIKLNDVKPAAERNAGNRQKAVVPASTDSKSQPPVSRISRPAQNKGKEPQPQIVNPPKKGQPPQPRNVKPSNTRAQQIQPKSVTPIKRDGGGHPSQPRTNEPKQEQAKPEENKRPGR
jgi:hypothetical protein